MDRIDAEMIDMFKQDYDLAVELLADIRAGRTQRPYSSAEIAGIEADRDRAKAWLDAADVDDA